MTCTLDRYCIWTNWLEGLSCASSGPANHGGDHRLLNRLELILQRNVGRLCINRCVYTLGIRNQLLAQSFQPIFERTISPTYGKTLLTERSIIFRVDWLSNSFFDIDSDWL